MPRHLVRPAPCRLKGRRSARSSSRSSIRSDSLRLLLLPDPMLARSAPLPVGRGWSYELKWDGFRAIVSTEDGLRVRSRRGWNMTPVLPELRELPSGLVLDGELVAWKGRFRGSRTFCRRVLNHDFSISLTYMIFDLLRLDGTDLIERPYSERRSILESLDLNGPSWRTTDVFDDGEALFAGVCGMGLEGVVAKKLTSLYRAGQRGWVKLKNPAYGRRDSEIETMRRSRERSAPRRCTFVHSQG
jgi:bifunctional non-homologous end joining protein LigD